MNLHSNKQTVLVVDDTPINIDVVKGILSETYFIQAAIDGQVALKIIEKKKPDLILLDIMMPEMDGYEVCRHLKSDPETRNIPIIFLTAKNQESNETEGFLLGAADYIRKPVNPSILQARVKTHLALYDQNRHLEDQVAERIREIKKIQEVTMVAMGSLAETRDPETGNHIRRTQHYVKLLAEKLVNHARFDDYLNSTVIDLLFMSAPLHDIGKVGVPDHILLKPGKLTNAEFEAMKKHTTYGRDAIQAAESILDNTNSFLSLAKEIAYSHQEKWDGSGYPEGLAGDDIPIPARLMAVADVYDALISRRIYKPPFSHEKAVAIITEGKGSHFDPDMVEAFLEIADEFQEISQRYMDSEEDVKKENKLPGAIYHVSPEG